MIARHTQPARFLEQYERDLLRACQELHMNVTGASDTLPFPRRIELLGFLKLKLKNWKDLNTSTKTYDDAVKKLIEVAVSESEKM